MPSELLLGLTESEQETLRAAIGKAHLIQNTSTHGKLELENQII